MSQSSAFSFLRLGFWGVILFFSILNFAYSAVGCEVQVGKAKTAYETAQTAATKGAFDVNKDAGAIDSAGANHQNVEKAFDSLTKNNQATKIASEKCVSEIKGYSETCSAHCAKLQTLANAYPAIYGVSYKQCTAEQAELRRLSSECSKLVGDTINTGANAASGTNAAQTLETGAAASEGFLGKWGPALLGAGLGGALGYMLGKNGDEDSSSSSADDSPPEMPPPPEAPPPAASSSTSSSSSVNVVQSPETIQTPAIIELPTLEEGEEAGGGDNEIVIASSSAIPDPDDTSSSSSSSSENNRVDVVDASSSSSTSSDGSPRDTDVVNNNAVDDLAPTVVDDGAALAGGKSAAGARGLAVDNGAIDPTLSDESVDPSAAAANPGSSPNRIMLGLPSRVKSAPTKSKSKNLVKPETKVLPKKQEPAAAAVRPTVKRIPAAEEVKEERVDVLTRLREKGLISGSSSSQVKR